MASIEFDIKINDKTKEGIKQVENKYTEFFNRMRKKSEEFADLFNELGGDNAEMKKTFDEMAVWADKSFKSQTDSVRGLQKALQEDQLSLKYVSDMMGAVTQKFKEGALSEDEYTSSMARLQVLREEICNSIEKTSEAMMAEARAAQLEEGSIESLKIKLSQLTAEYQRLSALDRDGEIGTNLLNEIKTTSEELQNAQQAMKGYSEESVQSFAEVENVVERISQMIPSLLSNPMSLFKQLPNMVDKLKEARDEYNNMTESGEEATPVWEQIIGATLNWKTALVAIIPIIIKNREAIGNWIQTLATGHEALSTHAGAVRAVRKAYEEQTGSVAESVLELEKLRHEWGELSSEKEKEEWIQKNKSAFDQLGVSINDVNTAETLFSSDGNTKRLIDAMAARAKASVAFNLAAKEYEKMLSQMSKAEKKRESAEKIENAYENNEGFFYNDPSYNQSAFSKWQENLLAKWLVGSKNKGAARKDKKASLKEENAESLIRLGNDFMKEWDSIIEGLGLKSEDAVEEPAKRVANNYVKSFFDGLREASNAAVDNPIDKLNIDLAESLSTIYEEYDNAMIEAGNDSDIRARLEDALAQRVQLVEDTYYKAVEKLQSDGLLSHIADNQKSYDEEQKRQAERKERLDGLRDQYATYQQQIEDINKKFDKDIEDMYGEDGHLLAGFDLNNVEEVNRQRQAALDDLYAQYDKTYQMIFKDISKMSRASIKAAMDAAKAWLADPKNKDSSLLKDYQQQLDALTDAYENYNWSGVQSGWDGIASSLSKIIKLHKQINEQTDDQSDTYKKLNNELTRQKDLLWQAAAGLAVNGFADAMKQVSDSMNVIADLSNDNGLRDTANILQTIGDAVTSAAAMGASSGSWIGALIGAAVSLGGSAVNQITHVEETKAQWEALMKSFKNSELFGMDESKWDTIFGVSSLDKAKEAYKVYEKSLSSLQSRMVALGMLNVNLRGKDNNTTLKGLDIWAENGLLDLEKAMQILETEEFKRNANNFVAQQLRDAIEVQQAYEKALSVVDDYLNNIVGDVADNLTDAIWNGIENGTDAWENFQESANATIKNIAKNMIKELLVTKIAADWQSKLESAFGGSESDMLATFTEFLDALETYIPEMSKRAEKLYNMIDGRYEDGADTAVAKGIAQASQDSVDELNGRFTAIQTHTFSINENVRAILENSQRLDGYMTTLLQHTSNLELMREYLYRIEASTDKMATTGVTML